MSGSHGRFVWYELMTSDVAAAEAFYGAVLGWEGQDCDIPGVTYKILSAGGNPVAGAMAMPPVCEGMDPNWTGYVAVEDVDAAAGRVAELGGTVHRAPDDIPGVGRFAIVADPQGAVFALFRMEREAPPPPAMGGPGYGAWRELNAVDGQAAFPFYAEIFGWTKDQAFDMGPRGVYQLVAVGGEAFGAMMTKPENAPRPFWLFYFAVPSIDRAMATVRERGGQVLLDPQQVPGDAWIIQCRDPQGAAFALVGPRS